MSDFANGKVVKLKSGGPKMVVVDGSQPGFTDCRWFDENTNSYKYDSFEDFALEEA